MHSFLCSERRNDSIVEQGVAERPRTRLLPITFLYITGITGVFRKKLCHHDTSLVHLRAKVGQKVGRIHIVPNIYHPTCKEIHTMLFLESSAEVLYRFSTASKKQLWDTMLVALSAKSLSLCAFVSVIELQLRRVTIGTTRGASSHTASAAPWKSRNTSNRCVPFSSTMNAALLKLQEVSDGAPPHTSKRVSVAVVETKSGPVA